MPIRSPGLVRAGIAALALGSWGCAPESPTGPSAPEAAAASVTTYIIRNLGTLGGTASVARAINNAGVIVGWSRANDNRLRAFVWKQGTMTDLGSLPGGEAVATAINQDGVIVGWSRSSIGNQRAVRWKDGMVRNLGTLGGSNSEALGINVFGEIVGWSDTQNGQQHAFLWKNGVMTDLGTLGGTYSVANGINNAGVVVGGSLPKSGFKKHAFRWKAGVMKDLGTLGTQNSTAAAINTAGQIVGSLGAAKDAVGEEEDFGFPFLYQSGVMTMLPTLQGDPRASALAISPGGVIVGQADNLRDDEGTEDAWVWENGTIQKLPELAVGHASANGINSVGTIIGSSHNVSDQIRAVLWRRQ